jgi:hypothetical protein
MRLQNGGSLRETMTLSGEKLVYPLTNGESLDASEIHAIRVQLKKIFESSMFQNSDRMRRFLDFAVEHDGESHRDLESPLR